MSEDDDRNRLLARLERLEAGVRRRRAEMELRRAPRRRRPAGAAAAAVLAVLATWVVAQNAVFKTDDNGTGDVVRFQIEPNGAPTGTPARAYFLNSYLGVGTSTYLARLDVVGTSAAGIRYLRTGAADARIQVGDPTKTWSLAAGAGAAGDFSVVEETGGAGTVRLNVQPGGNVGIGTASPTAMLEVVGNVVASAAGAGQVRLGNVAVLPASRGPGSLVYRTTDNEIYADINGTWTRLTGGGSGAGFPQYAIVVWSGSVGTIPAGWILCDGTLGTPDLRSRFIVGAGPTYTADTTGGSLLTHTHSVNVGGTSSTSDGGAHTHWTDPGSVSPGSSTWTHDHGSLTFTDTSSSNGGNHGHGGGGLSFTGLPSASGTWGSQGPYMNPTGGNGSQPWGWTGGSGGGGGGHTHWAAAADTPTANSHNHAPTFSEPNTESAAGGAAHAHTTDPAATASSAASNLPLYYALCYIMKQ